MKIKYTKHGMGRMNQRGITKKMVEMTITYGQCINDKIILKSRDIKKLLSKVTQESRATLIKILDKGGLVVVLSDDVSVITVYNKW